MKSSQKVIAIGLTLFISACSEPNEIDFVKDTYIDVCDTATVGDMLLWYFPTTNWESYQGETPTTFTIFGEGEIVYLGIDQLARLEFSYDSETGETTFMGGTFNGQDQPMPILGALIDNMCEEAS